MPTKNDDNARVADALNRLSNAMELLQARYDATERYNRRVRIAFIIVLVLFSGAMYKAITPIAEQLGTIPQMISQLVPRLKTATLDPEEAAAEKQRLMTELSPEERAFIERFEEHQKWVSNYIAASPDFDPGATIAVFLSDMASSVKVMPDLYHEVRSMTEEVRVMNGEMQAMNDKMNALPVLSTDVHGMHTQMTALPVLATEVKGMHLYMSIMARGVDSTMGETGRMLPWNW